MSEFEFPGKKEDDNQEAKKPDFIYIDDTDKPGNASWEQFHEKYSESFQSMTGKSFPTSFRFVFFILSFFLLIVAALVTPIVILFFLINLITLFTMKNFWKVTTDAWGSFKKILVICLGFFIAIFSPAFGIAIIFMYFVLKGKSIDDQFITRIIKTRMP